MKHQELSEIKFPFYWKEHNVYCAVDADTYFGVGLTGLSKYNYAMKYIEKNYSSIEAITRDEFLTQYYPLIQHQLYLRKQMEDGMGWERVIYSPIEENFTGNIH